MTNEPTSAADVDRAGALRIRAAELEQQIEHYPRSWPSDAAARATLEADLASVADELEQLERRARLDLEPEREPYSGGYTARDGKVYDDAGEEAGTARSARGRDLERHDRALQIARAQREQLERPATLRAQLARLERVHTMQSGPNANHTARAIARLRAELAELERPKGDPNA